ncbi:MAG: hypothetical protein V2I46_02825 [Bacteroides sp.]|jgi:hypothetical protein|nr:hypothetical protein [Bacteroides sp.]
MPKVNLLKSIEHPAKPAKRPKRKKVKFRKMTFKLTDMQYRALLTYCRRYDTTPVRYLKTLVNKQVERYKQELPPPPMVSENQLELF